MYDVETSTREVQLTLAISDWETSDGEKGEVFTKSEIVNLMLDVCGINSLASIEQVSVLEPSCGQGEFLVPVARKLLDIARSTERRFEPRKLSESILAFDLVERNVQIARERLYEVLTSSDVPPADARHLVESWVRHGDFLHQQVDRDFTHVIGNPPYVRVENIPKTLLEWYRANYLTMSDRSDLYIPFYEKGLRLLRNEGKLCFICTDRWMKNQYGRKLRRLISNNYAFDLYIDLYGSDAFEKKVLTYPAITLFSKRKGDSTLLCHNPAINDALSTSINQSLASGTVDAEDNLQFRRDILHGERPWLLGSADQLALVRRLEREYPTLEDAGCMIYIGAATGNNEVFVVDETVAVEPDRKLPVITASEIRNGQIHWKGKYIINTYTGDGVIDLDDYPLLARYLRSYESVLRKRHIAKNSPRNWYKTIDRVYPERAALGKLMIPDIKSELTLVYDDGTYHPNNSIYYVCSDTWNLHALKAVLISGIGNLFVQTYTTKVANGYLRFQAQHLRRIRIPEWDALADALKSALTRAGEENDREAAAVLVAQVYNLNNQERDIVGDY